MINKVYIVTVVLLLNNISRVTILRIIIGHLLTIVNVLLNPLSYTD